MTTATHQRALRVLTALLAVAVVVSIVHYSDNYVNYHDYPRSRTLPNPSAPLILGAWFAFTAAGLTGYLLFRRGPSSAALVLLAAYSGSGLVGIGHYLVPGATSMPWWRQLHVCLDIACGMAVFAFAMWAGRMAGVVSDELITRRRARPATGRRRAGRPRRGRGTRPGASPGRR